MTKSPEWVLSLPESEIFAWDIAFGEANGGEYDYKHMQWAKNPLPPSVLAVPGQLGGDGDG